MVYRSLQFLCYVLAAIEYRVKIMGGITVMFGDFRQTLPVIVKGIRANIVKLYLSVSNYGSLFIP